MILEITGVKYEPYPDAYKVTGQVGNATREVYVDALTVERRLTALGAQKSRSEYELRDLSPLVAQLATHDLSEAFSRRQ